MQVTLDAPALRRVVRSLTCLSKYGDEVTVYATTDHLSLSGTNSALSAYCRFKFHRAFFSRYAVGTIPSRNGRDNEGEDTQAAQGQVMAKLLLAIFKHRAFEKVVEKCDLSIVDTSNSRGDDGEDGVEGKLIVRLRCKHGVTKTHRLLLQTSSALLSPALPLADMAESHLVISSRALKDILEPFSGGTGDPQLVWTFGKEDVLIRSWDGGPTKGGADGGLIIQMATELRISVEEFDHYSLCEETCGLAFHLREFNATVSYADGLSLPLSLRFANQPNAPLFIEVESEDVHGLFVLSTGDVPRQSRLRPAVTAKKRAREENDHVNSQLQAREETESRVQTPAGRPQPRVHVRGQDAPSGSLAPESCTGISALPSRVAADRMPLFFPSQSSEAGLSGASISNAAQPVEVWEGEGVADHEFLMDDSWGIEESITHNHTTVAEDDLSGMKLGATQVSGSSSNAFHPLFED